MDIIKTDNEIECLQGGVKVPTGGIPRFGESPRAPSAWRGQQIRWEAGADGNSPDERRNFDAVHAFLA